MEIKDIIALIFCLPILVMPIVLTALFLKAMFNLFKKN